MSARSRRKGAAGEREIVALAQSLGLPATREWQNAQHDDPAVRAVDVKIAGRPCQVKRAAAGFSKFYDGLSNVEILFVREDGKPWLAVLHAKRLLKMIREKNPDLCHRRRGKKGLIPTRGIRPKAARGAVLPRKRNTKGQFKRGHRTRIQQAAARMARRSNEVQLAKYGAPGLRERAMRLKKFQFKKRSPRKPAAPAMSTKIGAAAVAAKPAIAPPEVKAVPTTVQPRTGSTPQPVVEKPSEVPAAAPTYTDLFLETMRERFEAGKKLDEAEMRRRAVEEYWAKH